MAALRHLRSSALVLAACLGAPCAQAGVTTVYKCFDSKLGVLYTDKPCKGESLDIEAGSVDPVAVAELQREREALSRAMAQRLADNRRVLPERDYGPAYVYAAPPYDVPEVYYPAYGGVPYVNAPRPRADDARPTPRRDRPGTVTGSRGDLIKR